MNYNYAIGVLESFGYRAAKRILINSIDGSDVVMDVEVEVSPILIDEKIKEIKSILPDFEVFKYGTGVIRVVLN